MSVLSKERLTERNWKDKCAGYMWNVHPVEHINDLRYYKKLAEYEDLEEQGLLLRIPCKVGDTVYVICECENIPKQLDGTLYGENGGPGTATGYYCPYEDNCPHERDECEELFDCDKFKKKQIVFEDEVEAIWIGEDGVSVITVNCPISSHIGEFVFLTKFEAEEKLRELELKKARNNSES